MSAAKNQPKSGKPATRSSGQKGPSQQPMATRTRRRRRRSGRSRRRQTNQMSKDVSVFSATSGADFKTYFRQGGAVVHKEWGTGSRFLGTSVLGEMTTTEGQTANFLAVATRQMTDGSGNIFYYDPYISLPNGNVGGVAFSLHPGLLSRLQNECLNWGRYCFRKLRIHFSASGSSTNPDGYVCALTHEVSWPLMVDQSGAGNTVTSGDTAGLENHASGSYWKSFSLQAADHKGDRTWPTGLVQFVLPDGKDNNVTGSWLMPYVEDNVQFVYITRNLNDASQTIGSLGFVYVEYVIDLYSPKFQQSLFLQEVIVPEIVVPIPKLKLTKPPISTSRLGRGPVARLIPRPVLTKSATVVGSATLKPVEKKDKSSPRSLKADLPRGSTAPSSEEFHEDFDEYQVFKETYRHDRDL